MASRALADTGALLAVLDASDAWHERCGRALPLLRGPLVTTGAVLTELFYFVGPDLRRLDAAWKFVQDVVTVEQIDDGDLPDLHALMARYHDRPMDFADATLVLVATRLNLETIFTIDHDDFETYRFAGRKKFRVVPSR